MPAPRTVSPPLRHPTAAALALALIGLLALGLMWRTDVWCPSEREVAAARSLLVAAVDGFVVRQQPRAGGRLEQDVELGLTVRREAREGSGGEVLPGVTLEVEQVDAAEKVKRHWRVWVDTAGLRPGGEIRSVHVLEDVEYAPGDGFRAGVRQEVPAAERAEYREFGGDASATGSRPTS